MPPFFVNENITRLLHVRLDSFRYCVEDQNSVLRFLSEFAKVIRFNSNNREILNDKSTK